MCWGVGLVGWLVGWVGKVLGGWVVCGWFGGFQFLFVFFSLNSKRKKCFIRSCELVLHV